MSLADLLQGNPDAFRVRLGTGSSAPSPDDTGVTGGEIVSVEGVTLDGSTRAIAWRMGLDAGAGTTWREVGVWLVEGEDEVFLVRRLLAAPVEKTADIQVRGVIAIALSFEEVPQVQHITRVWAVCGGEYASAGTLQIGTWTRRAGDTARVTAWWGWSGALAGPVHLEFRADDGSTVVHSVVIGDADYPDDTNMRVYETDLDVAEFEGVDHGEVWVNGTGSSGAVYVANVIVESVEAVPA